MAKSIQELIQLQKSARAVPTRNVPAIDWLQIVARLTLGETLVFKTDCKFHLPRNTTELADAIRKNGYTGNLKVRQPVAEVVVLDPCVPDVSTLGGGTDVPAVERSGRAKTGIVPQASAKRGRGRPRKDSYANGVARH